MGLDKEIENQVSHDLQKSIWCSHSPTAPKPPLRTLTSDKMTLRPCKLQQVRPLHLPYLSIENNVTRKGPNSLSSSLVTPSPCMFVNHHFYGLPGKIPIWRNWADPWGISLISMNNIILQWGTTRGTFIQQATGLSTYVCKHMQVHMYAHTHATTYAKTQKNEGLRKICFALISCLGRGTLVLFIHGLYAKSSPTPISMDLVDLAGEVSKNNSLCYDEVF